MTLLEQMYQMMYILEQLNEKSREQVPVTRLTETLEILNRINNVTTNKVLKSRIQDVMGAILSVKDMNIVTLTEDMKYTLCEGVERAKLTLAFETFEYHSKIDFEDTDFNRPIVMEVVQDVYQNGGDQFGVT